MRKVRCLVNIIAPLVGFLGGSVLEVYLDGVVKGENSTSGFVLQVILGGYICVLGPFTFHV